VLKKVSGEKDNKDQLGLFEGGKNDES